MLVTTDVCAVPPRLGRSRERVARSWRCAIDVHNALENFPTGDYTPRLNEKHPTERQLRGVFVGFSARTEPRSCVLNVPESGTPVQPRPNVNNDVEVAAVVAYQQDCRARSLAGRGRKKAQGELPRLHHTGPQAGAKHRSLFDDVLAGSVPFVRQIEVHSHARRGRVGCGPPAAEHEG